MQISVTFRHLDSNEEFRDYAKEKIRRIRKYLDYPIEAQVILTVEKFRNIAEVILWVNGYTINSQEETGDMFSSIDMAVDKLERQIKKYKDKIQSYKPNADTQTQELRMNIIASESFEEDMGPRIVKTKRYFSKPMSLEEAVLQLELMNDNFLVYTDAQTKNVNVIYRRKDGDYGLIEPERS
jgi:putative sigma-54 modulation protein